MRSYVWLLLICAPYLLASDDSDFSAGAPENINSRYTIESVELAGKAPSQELKARLSKALRSQLEKLVGQKYDQDIVDDLGAHIRTELHAAQVSSRVERGHAQDFIRLLYDTKGRRLDEDATVTKLSYHSLEGWTGGVEFAANVAPGLQLAAGVQSDADTLVSREAGYNARLTQSIGDHVRLRMAFEDFHEQWNQATLTELQTRSDLPEIYRTRREYEPSVAVAVNRYLTFTTGLAFDQIQTQYPQATMESANALDGTIRFHDTWATAEDNRQDVDASYNIRAATRLVDSDFVYVRHALRASYQFSTEHTMLYLRFMAGRLTGRAPLFERFSLGNTSNLRGWNKYEIDPTGGTHATTGSVDYRYKMVGVFYDVGSVGDDHQPAKVRSSAGASVSLGGMKNGITLAVAFPLRYGHLDPVFIMSTNF